MDRVPVTRPGWRATGATNCTHSSGAQVWLRWGEDRWVYWLPSEGERIVPVGVAHTRNYATRDEAMEAAELAIADATRIARALERHLQLMHPAARIVGLPVQLHDGSWEACANCPGDVVGST